LLAGSSCQSAVAAALEPYGALGTWRQYLREWLYDGADRAAPCQPSLPIRSCFAPLLGWVLRWWPEPVLPLAVDATAHHDRVVALVVSVLYRGSAIPVAWQIVPANQPGAWLEPIVALLAELAPAVPPTTTVLVLTDRGLWSPTLWQGIRAVGWYPLMRVQEQITFRPLGGQRVPARSLVPGPGHAWVGAGTAFKDAATRRAATLVVVWAEGQADPWVLLTALPPERVGVLWYGLRSWVELGFRALKGVGWRWAHTRRTDPPRVERHWLVLAVAMLWTLAVGTRVEDATLLGVPPGRVRTPPPAPAARAMRLVSVFRRGLSWVRWLLGRGRWWRRLWLRPVPLPHAPTNLLVMYHDSS
jgi:hypothetical protein